MLGFIVAVKGVHLWRKTVKEAITPHTVGSRLGGTEYNVAGSAVNKTLGCKEAVLDCGDGHHWSDHVGWILGHCLKGQVEKEGGCEHHKRRLGVAIQLLR